MSCENRTLNTRCLPKSICRNTKVVTGTTATTQRFNKAQCLQNKITNHIATIYHDPMSAKNNSQPQRNGLTKPNVCKKKNNRHNAVVYQSPMSAKKEQPTTSRRFTMIQCPAKTEPSTTHDVCRNPKVVTGTTAKTRRFNKARCLQKKEQPTTSRRFTMIQCLQNKTTDRIAADHDQC